MPLSRLSTPVAVLVGTLLIALALVAQAPTGRFQLAVVGPGRSLRIDTRSGKTEVCDTARRNDGSYYLACWR